MNIQTKAVALRPLERADLTDEYVGWLNDPETSRYLASGAQMHSKETLADYFEKGKAAGRFMLAICHDGKHVGTANLVDVNWIHRHAGYGYLVGRAYAGRGIGTAALTELCRFAFQRLGMHRIHSAIAVKNVASLRSADKVGFKREGVLRNHLYIGGQYEDCVAVGLLRDEFKH